MTKTTNQTKKVYVCSAFKGVTQNDIARHKTYARELTRAVIAGGYAPITPHLYITEVLNDRNPNERKCGLDVALSLMRVCDALLIGSECGISEGMRAEIMYAKLLGLPIILACRGQSDNGEITFIEMPTHHTAVTTVFGNNVAMEVRTKCE